MLPNGLSTTDMRILVNIFDPQEPLAAYLFLKQYYRDGDRLLFISTREERASISPYARLFQLPDERINVVSFLRNEDSYIYERICRRLRAALSHDAEYIVNLAGGSRYSALAVQHVFAGLNAKFYYVQTRENVVVSSVFDNSIDDNDDIIEPIRYRMTLAEYFELHGLNHDLSEGRHTPLRGSAEARRIFDCFRTRRLSNRAFNAIDLLRTQYRGCHRPYPITEISRGTRGRFSPIPGLNELLADFGFVPQKKDFLLPEEIDYLTGGWFEEYVYHTLLQLVDPQQIALSVRIARPDAGDHNNELDVVFIKANTLFVVECKTGVATEHLFNEIVYKACALKEAFLGMNAHSYIFTLKNDYDHHLSEVSNAMDITLCDKKVLADPTKISSIAQQMRRIAHEE